MADAINSVTGTASDAAPLRAATKAADATTAAPAGGAASAAATTATTTDATKTAQAPISPRLQTDYLTGTLVTQYVGSNGQVTLQLPSAAALAYLRAGLSADGAPLPKTQQGEPAQQQADSVS